MFVTTTNSNAKGAIAELEIAAAAVKLGIPFKPLSEHSRADLVLEIGNQFMRVQCKWGRLSPSGDVVIVMLRTSRYTPHGQVLRTYDEHEIDLFAVYCGELDRSFLLPASRWAGKQCIHLRVAPPRNRQLACINLADDFTFDGAVAQLARAMRWQRIGQGFESPQLHSSDSPPAPVTVSADACRDSFGQWMDRVAAGEDVVVSRRGKPIIRLTAAAPASTPLAVAGTDFRGGARRPAAQHSGGRTPFAGAATRPPATTATIAPPLPAPPPAPPPSTATVAPFFRLAASEDRG